MQRPAADRTPLPRAALPWLVWVLACALATVAAAGWPTDNGLATWTGGDPSGGMARLAELGGDEVVVLRLRGERAERRAFLERHGDDLRALPAVRDVVGPLELAAGAQGALEPDRAGPLARALDLVDEERNDLLLSIDPSAAPPRRAELAARLEQWSEEARGAGLELLAAGHPLVAAALDAQAARVERTFVPLLVVLATLVVALVLRSPALAVAAVLPAVLASSGARAVLAALGIPSNMILVALGPLALVIVLASTLQLVFTHRRRAWTLSAPQAARAARREKGPAALLAAATTAAGFAVFATSPLQPVARLGLAVACTTILAVPLAYLGLVPLLATVPVAPGSGRERKGRRLRHLAVLARRTRPLWLLVAVGTLLAGGLAVQRLPRETNALRYFAPDHPLRLAFEAIEHEDGGLSTVEVLVEPRPERDAEADLGRTLAAVEGVRGVLGPEHVRAEVAARGTPEFLRAGVETAALERAGRVDGAGLRARWTLRFATMDAGPTRELVDRVRAAATAWARERGTGEVLLTGTLPAMLAVQDHLVTTLLTSLGLTLVVTVLAFLVVTRGPRELAAVLVVNLFPVAVSLTAARLLGLALDAATVMVAAVVLGLAVDNTFHLVHHARHRKGAQDPTRRRLASQAHVGGAAAASALALAVGFACLCFSGFAPTARFGLLTACGAVGALVGDLVLLPALWLRPGERP